MDGGIVAFAIIGILVLAGYVSTRFNLVTLEQGPLLNRLSFYVFSPALLFAALSKTAIENIFSPVLLVLIICAISVAVSYIILSRLFFKRDLGATTIGATAAVYLNSNNIGLPVSIFVLGDVAYFAPVLMLQLVLFLPIILGFLEASTGREVSIWAVLMKATLNPLILASLVGVAVAALQIDVPEFIYQPVHALGQAAVPLLLFAYGVSLNGQKLFHVQGDRAISITAIASKTAVMPFIAFVMSDWVFHLSAHEIYASVILASLPTAQNIFTYASVYKVKEYAVRDVVFLTTVLSLPIMFLIAATLQS